MLLDFTQNDTRNHYANQSQRRRRWTSRKISTGNKENKTKSWKEEGKRKSAFEINIEKSAKQFRRTKEISRINTKEDRLEEEKLKSGENKGREKENQFLIFNIKEIK